MLFSFVVLPIAVAFSAAVGLVRTNLALGLICACLAVALITLGASRYGSYLSRPRRSPMSLFAVVVLLLPCLWMLLQAIPLPGDWLSNAVWSSASNALGSPVSGSITVDTGATLLAFVQYCAALSTASVVMVVAFDRRMAELTLYFLTFVAVSAAVLRIVDSLGYLDLAQHNATGDISGTSILAAAGVTLASATEVRLRERLRSRRSGPEPRQWAIAGFIAGAIGLAICTLALLIEADIILIFAGLFGAGVLIGILVVRQWSFGAWGRAGVIAVGAITLLTFLATVQPGRDTGSATTSSSQNQTVVDRMLSDAPALGSGAGTFESLLPVYREVDHAQSGRAEVAAALITIEMGRTFLWIFILALGGIATTFARGAVTRGRDYVYASAGAGVVVVALILVFTNGGVLTLPASIFVSAVAGLAWSQSRSTIENAALAHSHTGTAEDFYPTENSPEPRMKVALLAGLILIIEAFWLLLPEQHISEVVASPFVDIHSTVSIYQRNSLKEAATIAGVRGDLWAESAFAGTILLLKRSEAVPSSEKGTLGDLTRALRYAPLRSDVWLTFALLAERYRWPNADPKALLKMAYYTGPNETSLIPPRLKATLRLTGGPADPELQDMIKGDISLIFRRLPALKPILANAYKTASTDGRALAERIIGELNPDYLKIIRNQ